MPNKRHDDEDGDVQLVLGKAASFPALYLSLSLAGSRSLAACSYLPSYCFLLPTLPLPLIYI